MATRLVNDVLDLTSPASFPNTIKQSLKTALSNHIINEIDIPLAAMTGVGVYKAALNQNIHPEQIYRAVQAGIKAIPQAKRTGDAFSSDLKRKAFVTGQQIALAAVNNLPAMQKQTRDVLKNQIHQAISSFTYATAPETYSNASLKGGFFILPAALLTLGALGVGGYAAARMAYNAGQDELKYNKIADSEPQQEGEDTLHYAYRVMEENLKPDPKGMYELTRTAIEDRTTPADLTPESVKLFKDVQSYTQPSVAGSIAQVAAASMPYWLPEAINYAKRWKKGRDLTEEEEDQTDKISGIINGITAAAIPVYHKYKLDTANKMLSQAKAQHKIDVANLGKMKEQLEEDTKKFNPEKKARVMNYVGLVENMLDPDHYPVEAPLDLYSSVKPLADAYRASALEVRGREREKKKAKTELGRQLVQQMLAREKAEAEERRQRALVTNVSPAGQARMIYQQGINPKANFFTMRRPIAGIRRARPLETLEEETISQQRIMPQLKKGRKQRGKRVKGGKLVDLTEYADEWKKKQLEKRDRDWAIAKEIGKLALEAGVGTALGGPGIGVAAVAKHLAPTAMALIDSQKAKELQEKIRKENLELKQDEKLVDFAKRLAQRIAKSDGNISESEKNILDTLIRAISLIQDKQKDKIAAEAQALML